MKDTQDLGKVIDAAFLAMEQKRTTFQKEQTEKRQQWVQRLERLGRAFDGLGEVWKPRLELLAQKFGDRVKVVPTITPSTRSVAFAFQSDVARIQLRLQATTDSEVSKIILNYDLDVLPILMQFESHAQLEMQLDAVDPEKVAGWLDERIVSFVKAYIAIQENQYYLRDQMVEDPVSGTKFPKVAAGATLERNGRTYYFVSEETRREFESKDSSARKAPTEWSSSRTTNSVQPVALNKQ